MTSSIQFTTETAINSAEAQRISLQALAESNSTLDDETIDILKRVDPFDSGCVQAIASMAKSLLHDYHSSGIRYERWNLYRLDVLRAHHTRGGVFNRGDVSDERVAEADPASFAVTYAPVVGYLSICPYPASEKFAPIRQAIKPGEAVTLFDQTVEHKAHISPGGLALVLSLELDAS